MDNLAKSAKAFISATAVAIIELPKIKAKTTKDLHKQMDPLLNEMVDKFIAAQAAAFGYGLFAGDRGRGMKRLDELGVSPTPWKKEQTYWVADAHGNAVADCYRNNENVAEVEADAALIAAAPDLYECLRNLIEACGAVGYKDGGTAACYESEHKLYRALWDAEAALYKAGGAE